MKLFRWIGTAAASVAVLLGGGFVEGKVAQLSGLSDGALDRAFKQAFGLGSAKAQEISFLTYLADEVDLLPRNASQAAIIAAVHAAIKNFVAAGGTVLPTMAAIVAAFPQLDSIGAAYVAAVSDAVADSTIKAEVAVAALGGNIS